MKINFIPKLQQGGAFAPPYAVYQPLPQMSQSPYQGRSYDDEDSGSRRGSGKKEASSKNLTDKDLLTMLEKLDGLPSDMAVITKKLTEFYVRSPLEEMTGVDSSNIAVRYIDVLHQLKVANFNKKEYDHAYDRVKSNGGIEELAITNRGQFIVRNTETGEFALMTAEELKESEGYVAMTNSDLLKQRANDPSLANNNELLSVVQNGIGMEVVNKQIKDIIAGLGEKASNEKGYVSTKAGELIQGIEGFEKAIRDASGTEYHDGTIRDLYRFNIMTKNQAEQAAEAIKYIYSTLTPNAKALLKSKSDLTDNGAIKLIQTLIASQVDSTREFDIELIRDANAERKTKKGKEEKENELDFKSSQLTEIMNGTGGAARRITLDDGTGAQQSVTGRGLGVITDMSGKAITNTSMLELITESGIAGIAKDMNKITFGDQSVTVEGLKKMAYANSGATRAILPKTADGRMRHEILADFLAAQKEIDALPTEGVSEEAYNREVRNIFKSYGLNDLYLSNGKLNTDKFGVFLLIDAYATDKYSGVDESKFMKKITDTDEINKALEYIEESTVRKVGSDYKEDYYDKFNPLNIADWFGLRQTVFKGVVYIPLDNNVVSAVRLDGNKISHSDSTRLNTRYIEFNERDPESTEDKARAYAQRGGTRSSSIDNLKQR